MKRMTKDQLRAEARAYEAEAERLRKSIEERKRRQAETKIGGIMSFLADQAAERAAELARQIARNEGLSKRLSFTLHCWAAQRKNTVTAEAITEEARRLAGGGKKEWQ